LNIDFHDLVCIDNYMIITY